MSRGTQYVQLMNDSITERANFESEKVGRSEKDARYVLDSVLVETRNDTVYHTRWRTEYRDRVVERRDTVRLSRSVAELVRTSKESSEWQTDIQVEKRIPPWCWWLLVGNVLFVGLWVAWKIYRFRL